MSAGHLDDILRSAPQRPVLVVLVELDRATAQDLDILMQAVTTRLEFLERYHFQHSTSCDAHHPALDLVAS